MQWPPPLLRRSVCHSATLMPISWYMHRHIPVMNTEVWGLKKVAVGAHRGLETHRG